MRFKTNKFIFLLLVIFIYSCEKTKVINNNSSDDEDIKKIIILYTNDEHGWIEKSQYSNGAAEMMGLWRANEEYDSDESYLILSGGDNWTGPAISTWFEGESTVDVMNAMEYDASAIGNHEFDFKVEDGLEERIMQANFPYLSANIREKASGDIPDFVTPYIILDIDDVMVGIIGLTTITTPWSTFPDYVADYDFIDYFSALEEVVPQVKQDGAELLIVIAHICYSEIVELAPTLINLGISVIGGGHCHAGLISQIISSAHGELAVIKTNSLMQGYAKIEISYDIIEKEIVSAEPSAHINKNGNPDQAVANVVSYWRDQTDAELSGIIGYTDSEIVRESGTMHNMVADSWLYQYPDADIAMTNASGIRQSIPAGDINKEIIIGVLPFQNYIIELELTGAEVINCTDYADMIFGGMTTVGGYFLLGGTEIDDNTTYSVLTTDFLYAQNDYRFPFSQYDPSPYYTSMNYHQPTIDWISSLNTSASNPLDNYLDDTARR